LFTASRDVEIPARHQNSTPPSMVLQYSRHGLAKKFGILICTCQCPTPPPTSDHLPAPIFLAQQTSYHAALRRMYVDSYNKFVVSLRFRFRAWSIVATPNCVEG
jgi:hypothetical protein